MKQQFLTGAAVLIASLLTSNTMNAQSFFVTLDKPENGTITVTPPLPADGKYSAGTVVTVKGHTGTRLCSGCHLLCGSGSLGEDVSRIPDRRV